MLSLCIIAGNVERYIQRFIDSFSPLVDEIVVVIARGNQPMDKTAAALSRNVKVRIVDQYFNQPQNEHWPHVDDFAAARNKAFSLAQGDWIMWADTDDTIDAESIERIKAAMAAHPDADAFSLDYRVPEDGLTVDKVRIVKRGRGQWRHRVHEELVVDALKVVRIEGAEILHAPTGTRAPNDQRNLTLLNAMKNDGDITIGHEFHRVTSLRACGMMEESVAAATALVQRQELASPERFELLMMLGEMCADEAKRGQLYLQAHGICPDRREAYGELAIWCCRVGKWSDMLAWTTAMMSIPKPDGYLWNHRSQYYGHAGIRLHAMALRLNGQRQKADVMQQNFTRIHPTTISLLHATRGRSKEALAAQRLWLARAYNPDAIEHIFAIDADDEQAMPLAANLSVVCPPGGGCVAAWNAAADLSCGDVLVQLSDDWMPPLHWDKIITERIGEVGSSAVLAISDGHRDDNLLCMAILTRKRWHEQGYLFHPSFKSVYSDNWFTHCAYRDGVVIDARDVVFEHQHPLFTGAEAHPTTIESNAPERYREGEAVFNELMKRETP